MNQTRVWSIGEMILNGKTALPREKTNPNAISLQLI